MKLSNLAILTAGFALCATAQAQVASTSLPKPPVQKAQPGLRQPAAKPYPTKAQLAAGAGISTPILQPTTSLLGGNDNCATPDVIVGTGAFSVDTTVATDSLGAGSVTCGGGVCHNDVWFEWTAPLAARRSCPSAARRRWTRSCRCGPVPRAAPRWAPRSRATTTTAASSRSSRSRRPRV